MSSSNKTVAINIAYFLFNVACDFLKNKVPGIREALPSFQCSTYFTYRKYQF